MPGAKGRCRSPHRGSHGQSGATLIELVLVIVIGSILAAVAWPRFQGLASVRLIGASQKLVSDLRYAQRLAMTARKIYGLEFDIDEERYRVYDRDSGLTVDDPYTGSPGGPAGTEWTSGLVVNYTSDPQLKGVYFNSTAMEPRILFDNLGRPWHLDGFGNLVENTQTRYIQLAYQGEVRVVNIFPRTGFIFQSDTVIMIFS